mgnify:CR=1 FL=1
MEFLQYDTFLKSIDCRVVEEFLLAYKFLDVSQLNKAQTSPDNYIFEKDMMDIIRKLSFKGEEQGMGLGLR